VDAKKGAIIILVLIGVLFAVVLLTSPGQKNDRGKIDTDFFSGISDRFTKKRNVQPDELGGGSFTMRGGAEFVTAVAEAKGVQVRTMHLEMTGGSAMEIELDPKGDYGVPVKVKLDTNSRKTPPLQVFEKGAVLQARCTGPDPTLRTCTLQLSD
jgi:hypothetical protein